MLKCFLCVILLLNSITVFAFETDQFNLPEQPLADVGDEVTTYVAFSIKKAIDKINNEITERENCLQNLSAERNLRCDSAEENRRKLAYLRSDKAVAREIYNLLGTGIPPFTNSGSWMESHKFKFAPARYKTNYRDSIYFTFPIDYLGLGSTVNLYDTQFGTDKIAHFFQQGYSYFKIYNRALDKGLKPEQAVREAVEWGQKTERTVYGTLVSGVYSNADLYANYVGMKFYLRLTQPLEIKGTVKPSTLILTNGLWKFNGDSTIAQQLIKPFISNHLNEAFNPSIYTKFFGLRAYVRRTVRKQSCRRWFEKYPHLSKTELQGISERLKLWNGEDYGFTDSENFITIANTCFDDGNSAAPKESF